MKAELDPAIHFLRGSAGNFVYRKIRGKTILSQRPVADKEPTAGQLAHRERFKEAARYGKLVLADESVRVLYQEAAQRKDVPIFSIIIADYFNVPTIDTLDISSYVGQPGNVIKIRAYDDFGVANVHVSITDQQGNGIENGDAVESPEGSGQWSYIATVVAPSQTRVIIQAVATDRPGGTAIKTESINF